MIRPSLPRTCWLILLVLFSSHCATERIATERLDVALGKPPIRSRTPTQGASAATIAELARNSTLPTSISADTADFDYLRDVGALPTSTTGTQSWLGDFEEARHIAREKNQPLLLWFSNNQVSSNDLHLSDQVLGHDQILRAVTNRCVRVRLDYANSELARTELYERLRSQFGARGFPFMVVTLPDGTPVQTFKGFRPEWRQGYLDNIPRAIDDAIAKIDSRQKQLGDQGYRWWTNGSGVELFAEPLQYDPQSSAIALRGMWGDQWIVPRQQLSQADQLFLASWTTAGVPGRVRGQ